jgi:phosphoribosylanthranilate isomerase
VSGFKPYGVDVSSGVELSVRVKDLDKVRAFVHAVRLAEALM